MTPRFHRVFALLILIANAPLATAQYTAVELYPMTPPADYYNRGGVAAAGQTAGMIWYNKGPEGLPPTHAALWSSTGKFTDLQPSSLGFVRSEVYGTDGTQQVGSGRLADFSLHALLWNGNAGSAIDLNPSGANGSAANATSGGQQVGYAANHDGGYAHAFIWTGSAASAIDLNPKNIAGIVTSELTATDGTHQVGSGGGTFGKHAFLWSGTADSAVDLHPVGYDISTALGVGGDQQVGSSSVGNQGYAMLWRGTSQSAINLNPDGYTATEAVATNGMVQAGRGGGPAMGSGGYHALAWSGTAASVIDLHKLLPDHFASSSASSVDANGVIYGTAVDSSLILTYAIAWMPQAPRPGDANLDGAVNFADLVRMSEQYGAVGGWSNGDFNTDQIVDFSDLLALARQYGSAPTANELDSLEPDFRSHVEAAFAQVPEPPIAALLSVVLGAVCFDRRWMR